STHVEPQGGPFEQPGATRAAEPCVAGEQTSGLAPKSMKQINAVEESDIARLNGDQLPRLLHILLCAEARKRNIDKSGIKVPFIINVADGGSDGEWKGKIEENDFIPNEFTKFQCKA